MDDRRRALSVTEAAAILGISRSHAYGLVTGRDLPMRLGRRILVPRAAIDDLLGQTPEAS